MEKPIEQYSQEFWVRQLDMDEKRLRSDWWNYADKVVKQYKDKRDGEKNEKKVNLFWTNVGVMKAALYATPPKPMVSRTWCDFNDNIGRVSAEILQRCLAFDLSKNTSPMNEAIKLAVEDRLIPGLGQIWMRYAPTIETRTIPEVKLDDGTVLFPDTDYEEVTNETVITEYAHWRDIVFPSARVASEVWYLGRKLYKTRAQIEETFGKEIATKLTEKPVYGEEMATDGKNNQLPKNFTRDKYEFYEIWCKKNRKVYWVSRYCTDLLKSQEDPLELDNFYPCPMPLLATHTTDDYIPRPDFYMVKDQYNALNDLNARISLLESALKVVGVYNKKNDELKRILTDATENDMIPVSNWAMLAEGGGLKGQVDWFPVEQVAAVLEKLTIQKREKIEEVYMLTGISDIMRGVSNPRDTLGAQQLKAQYSSVRLQYLQDEIANFVKEALIIKAEIICRHFQPQSIMDLSQIGQSPDAQYAPEAIAMLKDNLMVHYRVDINEESLALPDYTQEKQMRIDFLTTIGQFLSQAAPMVQAMPGALPYMIQMIRWVAAGFKGSSEIQGVLDQGIAAMQQPQAQQQQPDPMKDPKVIAAQIKAEDNKSSGAQKHQTAIEQEQLKQKGQIQQVVMQSQHEAQKHQQTIEAIAVDTAARMQELQKEQLNALQAENLSLKNDIIRQKLKEKEPKRAV